MHDIDLLIIESQLEKDKTNGFKEGKVLRDILAHDGFSIGYQHIENRGKLADLLKHFANEMAGKESRVPAIHIAAHGHDEAISLSDGDQVPWLEFWDMFMVFKDSPLILVGLSICEGFHSVNTAQKMPGLPIYFLVGTDKNVVMGDSLIGFAILYHLMIKKEQKIKTAVELMNKGINEDIFQCTSIATFEEETHGD